MLLQTLHLDFSFSYVDLLVNFIISVLIHNKRTCKLKVTIQLPDILLQDVLLENGTGYSINYGKSSWCSKASPNHHTTTTIFDCRCDLLFSGMETKMWFNHDLPENSICLIKWNTKNMQTSSIFIITIYYVCVVLQSWNNFFSLVSALASLCYSNIMSYPHWNY